MWLSQFKQIQKPASLLASLVFLCPKKPHSNYWHLSNWTLWTVLAGYYIRPDHLLCWFGYGHNEWYASDYAALTGPTRAINNPPVAYAEQAITQTVPNRWTTVHPLNLRRCEWDHNQRTPFLKTSYSENLLDSGTSLTASREDHEIRTK